MAELGNVKAQPQVAPLGRRFAAAVVDRIVPALLVGLWQLFVNRTSADLIVTLLFAFLLTGWIVWQWWNYAIHKAGVGYQLFNLQLVGIKDGKPIGWWRMFIRSLILNACWALVFPGIALCIFLVIHQRRQGWHDLAVGSLTVAVTKQSNRTTSYRGTGVSSFAPQSGDRKSVGGAVALPPHLRASDPNAKFAAQPEAPRPATPIGQVPGAAGRPMPTDEVEHTAPIGRLPDWGPDQANQQAMPQPTWPPTTQSSWQPQPTSWQPQVPADPAPASRLPQAAPQPAPAIGQPVRFKGRSAADIKTDDYEGTRLVKAGSTKRPANEGWRVRLDNGTDMAVQSVLLVGRRPQAKEQDGEAELLSVGEPDSSVSKTHLMVFVDERGCFIKDRGSTNGTALMSPSGELVPCEPHDEVRVQEGQVVSFGERSLRVLRSPAGA